MEKSPEGVRCGNKHALGVGTGEERGGGDGDGVVVERRGVERGESDGAELEEV